MDITVTTLAQRPELADRLYEVKFGFPKFMSQDKIDAALFGQLPQQFPEYVLVATDADSNVVARGHSVPFALHTEGRRTLPPDGWDRVLLWAFRDLHTGTPPDTVSALLIMVDQQWQGRGLSRLMLTAMRDNVRAQGMSELVAPVRPTENTSHPTSR